MDKILTIWVLILAMGAKGATLSPKASDSLSFGQPMVKTASAVPMVIVPPPVTGSINLAWNPSTDPGLTYKAYYGSESHKYTNFVVSATNQATVSNLSSESDYYFAVTAVNSIGVESNYSNEVTTAPPRNQIVIFDAEIKTNLNGQWLFYTNVLRLTNPPAPALFMRLKFSQELFY